MCVGYVTSITSNSLQPYGRSLPGSSVHGILWARIREWVAMPSSREYSWPIQEQYKNKNYVFTWQRNKGNLDKSLLWFRDGVIESNGSWVLVS